MADLRVLVGPNFQWSEPGTGKLTREAQNVINTIIEGISRPLIFLEYTVATVPSAAAFDNGVIIVSNEAGGRTLATSDGTNWRRVSDGAVIS